MSFNERWPWPRFLKWVFGGAFVWCALLGVAYLYDPVPFEMMPHELDRLWHWKDPLPQVAVEPAPIEESRDTGEQIAKPAVVSKSPAKRGLPQTTKADPAPKVAPVSAPKQVAVPFTKKTIETQKPAQKSEAERLWQAGANPAPFDQLPSPIPFKEPVPVPVRHARVPDPVPVEIKELPPAPVRHARVPDQAQIMGPSIVSNGATVSMEALKAGLWPVETQVAMCNWDDIRRSQAAHQPLTSGTIEFEYVVGIDGNVAVTRVRRDTMKHPELRACVITAIGLMRVEIVDVHPAPTTVLHPFLFQQF